MVSSMIEEVVCVCVCVCFRVCVWQGGKSAVFSLLFV